MGLSNLIDNFFEGMKSNMTNRALKKAEKTKVDPRIAKQMKKMKKESDDYNRLMKPHK